MSKSSFQNLITKQNTFIGKWHHNHVTDYLELLANGIPIPWANYHTLFPPFPLFDNQDCFNFVDAIRKSPKNKIIISNVKNIPMKKFFNAQHYIQVPENNWFDTHSDRVEELIKKYITNDTILLFSAGMGSKPLINRLIETFPECTYLDNGSAFDFIIRGVSSRDHVHPLELERSYFNTFLV